MIKTMIIDLAMVMSKTLANDMNMTPAMTNVKKGSRVWFIAFLHFCIVFLGLYNRLLLSIYHIMRIALQGLMAFQPNDYEHNYSSPHLSWSADIDWSGERGDHSNPPVYPSPRSPCPSELQLILVNTHLISADPCNMVALCHRVVGVRKHGAWCNARCGSLV